VTQYMFEVVVRLKEGLLDPQGKAIEDALPHMGWTNVSDIHVGKHIELTVEADDVGAATEQVRQIAHQLLANPVIEQVSVSTVPVATISTGPARPGGCS